VRADVRDAPALHMLCRTASPGEKSRAELSKENPGRLAQLDVAAASRLVCLQPVALRAAAEALHVA